MSTRMIDRVGNLHLHEGVHEATGEPLLRLDGLLDADAAPGLTVELERRLQTGAKRLHLDMASVSFISSAGIGSLIASVGEYRDESGDIILHAIPEDLLHIFDMLGLLDYVTRAD